MPKKVINAFNAGEVSPYVYARQDSELYDKACLKMENFIPLEYGGATKRPATKFISELDSSPSLVYPFIFNTDTTYVLVFSKLSLTVYKDGVETITLETDYDENELYGLKFFQSFDVLFIAHKNHEVNKLQRFADSDWSLTQFQFLFPPLLDETDTRLSISGETAKDSVITITASDDIFYSTHVGSTFVIKQKRDNANKILTGANVADLNDDGDVTDIVDGRDEDDSRIFVSNAINVSFSNWNIETQGIWRGQVVVLRSKDGGLTYEEYVQVGDTTNVAVVSSSTDVQNKNFTFASSAPEEGNVFLKVQWVGVSGSSYDSYDNFSFTLKAENEYVLSPCTILTATGATTEVPVSTATAVVQSALLETVTSYDKADGYWVAGRAYSLNDKVLRPAQLSVTSTNIAGNGNTDNVSSIISSNSVATVNLNNHGASVGDLIVIAGCEEASAPYNGTFKVKTATTNSLTYDLPVQPADATAQGTPTLGKAVTPSLAALTSTQTIQDIAYHNNKLFILLQDTSISNFESQYNIVSYPISSSGNHDLASGTLTAYTWTKIRTKVDYTGIAFANGKMALLGYKPWRGNYSDRRKEIQIDEYDFDETANTVNNGKRIIKYKLMKSGKRILAQRQSFGLGYYKGHYYATTKATQDIKSTGNSYVSTYRMTKWDATKKTSDLGGGFIKQKSLFRFPTSGSTIFSATQSNTFDEIAQSYTEIFGNLYVLNDHTNLIEEYNENLSKQARTFPLQDENFVGITGTNTGSNEKIYAVTADRKFVEYTLKGDRKTFQCQIAHTASSDFETDLALGRWAERFPSDNEFQESAFSNFRGFPEAVAIFENRLCLAGTKNNPNTLFLSETDNLDNFALGVLDTDAMKLTFNSGTLDQIKWLCPSRELVIGTAANEWSLGSGSQNLPITPSQLNLKRRSQYGSSGVQGLLVNSAVLFPMREGKKLREWYLQENQNDYLAQDLSAIAEHITGDGIKQLAVQNQPTTIVWMIRENGELVGLTYERESNTFAWHRQNFNFDLKYLELDGVNDYVQSAHIPFTNTDQIDFTMHFRIKKAVEDATGEYLFHQAGSFGVYFEQNKPNELILILGANRSTGAVTEMYTQTLVFDEDFVNNQWHTLRVIVDPSSTTDNITVTIDDIEPLTEEADDGLTVGACGYPSFNFATRNVGFENSNQNGFPFLLGVGMMYNGSTYSSEAIAPDVTDTLDLDINYANLILGTTTKFTYTFDKGSGTTVFDKSASSSNATIVNNTSPSWKNVSSSYKAESVAVLPDTDNSDKVFVTLKDPYAADIATTVNYRITAQNVDNVTDLNTSGSAGDNITLPSGRSEPTGSNPRTPRFNTFIEGETDATFVYRTEIGEYRESTQVTANSYGGVDVFLWDNTGGTGQDLHIRYSGNANIQTFLDTGDNNDQTKVQIVYQEAGTYDLVLSFTATGTGAVTSERGIIERDDDGNFVSFTADNKSTGEIPLDLGKRCLVELDPIEDYTDYKNQHSGLDLYVRERIHNGNTFTGLSHLEGKEVTIKKDGVVETNTKIVTDGQITLDSSSTNANVVVGLPYTATLAPLYLDAEGSMGYKKSAPHATIRFKDTLEAKVGQKETGTVGSAATKSVLDDVKFASSNSLNTEDAEVWLANHNEFLQTIYVVSDTPQPCTVLAMVVDVEGVR